MESKANRREKLERIVLVSIEDDFMAWTTIFWENVCRKYELVINADGTSWVPLLRPTISLLVFFISMRQYKRVEGPFTSETTFTGEIGRLKSYEKQKPYVLFLSFTPVTIPDGYF